MTIATVNDVAVSLGRTISDFSPEETAQVQAWLNRIEARIKRRIPAVLVMALDPTYAEILQGVEVDVVARRVLNPEGKTSEKVDDYAYGLTATAAAAFDLWPTDAEWAELAPVRTTGAFSIRPQLSA